MQSLYIDESGYNGPDLLNEDQPVFAIGGIAIDEDSAVALKNAYFPEYGREELKHSKLYSDDSKSDRLIGIMRECLETRYVIVCVIEKKFLACEIFILDMVARFRPDIQYGSDRFRKLAWSLRTLSKESVVGEEFDKLLFQYVRTVSRILRKKEASDEKIMQEYKPLYEAMCRLKDPTLFRLCLPAILKNASVALYLKHSPLSGCAQGGLFGLITRIENDLVDKYEIVFDKSPSIVEFRPTIENLRTCSSDMAYVSKETRLELPLKKLKGMREVDSKASVGAQFADLIAGSAARAGLLDFGGMHRVRHDNYDNAIRELWDRHPQCRLYKPTFDNDGFDYSRDSLRIIKAASGLKS